MIWVVVISAVLAAFFSLASYSLRSFRRTLLQEALGEESHRIEQFEKHLTPLRLTVSFCRLTSNVVMVTALVCLLVGEYGWTGGAVGGAIAIAVGIGAIFEVAIPHWWSHYAGESVIAGSYRLLMALRYAAWPVVAVMQAFDLPIRRLAGVSELPEDESDAAKQEILQAATEGAAEGSVEHEEVEMIASVMNFGQRQAAQVMTPRTDIFALPVRTPWAKACQEAFASGHTRVPVYEGDLDNIIGVLYAKDLLRSVGADQPADLRTLIRKAYFVPESKPLDDLLREFKLRQVHLAVVLDEYGGTAGVISFEDVLEEIVGDISDEYDRGEPALMHRIDPDSAEVDGRMYIDDLNKALGTTIPQESDYITVAGMVLGELGYIPKVGETLDAFGARFTVLAADERRINRLKVEPITQPPPEE